MGEPRLYKRSSFLKAIATLAITGTIGSVVSGLGVKEIETPDTEGQEKNADSKTGKQKENSGQGTGRKEQDNSTKTQNAQGDQNNENASPQNAYAIEETKTRIRKLIADYYAGGTVAGFMLPVLIKAAKQFFAEEKEPFPLSRRSFLKAARNTAIGAGVYGAGSSLATYETIQGDKAADVIFKGLPEIRELLKTLPEKERKAMVREMILKSGAYAAGGIVLGEAAGFAASHDVVKPGPQHG
jgi:hypothetical protein